MSPGFSFHRRTFFWLNAGIPNPKAQEGNELWIFRSQKILQIQAIAHPQIS